MHSNAMIECSGPRGQQDLFFRAFQEMPVGVAIFEESCALVFANKSMFGAFEVEPRDVAGKGFGEVFECAHFKAGGVPCGSAEGCESCQIVRKFLRRILDRRKGSEKAAVLHEFRPHGKEKTLWFHLSGNAFEAGGKKMAVLVFIDITYGKKRELSLARKFRTDQMTGALNRYGLEEALQELAGPGAASASFSIGMVDLDNFKAVNDECGHLTGDRVLKTFSEIARMCIRHGDVFARYGGEEFIFIFFNTSSGQAAAMLRRIQRELTARSKAIFGQKITFSAGLLHVSGANPPRFTSKSLIEAVDRLMYRAKESGKACIVAEEEKGS